MSIEAINSALNLPIAATAKLVAIVLANYADADGKCWPSFSTLSEKTSLSRRSVIQQINYLERLNLVKKAGLNYSGSNVYKLIFSEKNFAFSGEPHSPPSEQRSPGKDAEVVNDVHHLESGVVNNIHQGSEPHSLDLVNDVHPPSERRAPKPSYNHHITIIEPSLMSEIEKNEVDVKPRKQKKSKQEVDELSEAFLRFWESYPRKDNKQKSIEIWKRKKLDAEIEEIIFDLSQRNWTGDKFTPLPTSYLNARRWEDKTRGETKITQEINYAPRNSNHPTNRGQSKSYKHYADCAGDAFDGIPTNSIITLSDRLDFSKPKTD